MTHTDPDAQRRARNAIIRDVEQALQDTYTFPRDAYPHAHADARRRLRNAEARLRRFDARTRGTA